MFQAVNINGVPVPRSERRRGRRVTGAKTRRLVTSWTWFVLLALATVGSAAPPSGTKTPLSTTPELGRAEWIWSSKQALKDSRDVCLLRKKFTLADQPEQATIALTADNGFDLYVNGQHVAGESGTDGSIWQSVERFRIEKHLLKGANVIAIRAENLGGPGGVVAAVRIHLPQGEPVTFVTDESWLVAAKAGAGWNEADHDDSLWRGAVVLGKMGIEPWGTLEVPVNVTNPKRLARGSDRFSEPGANFRWPRGVVFVAGKVPMTLSPQAQWSVDGSRAFFEHDTPTPPALGHRLYALVPARPDTKPRLLVDAGRGLIGGPTCGYDGREIIFAMVPEGEKRFHLFRIDADGSGLKRLTDGCWHDFDPTVLPDGRIVFASTRIGSREEYHGNTARSLFALSADRKTIRPLTYHIVGDTEPVVMADGRIALVRSDNFFERAKVETHIHAVRPDGTGGQVLLGPHRGQIDYDRPTGAEHSASWLRNLGFGCPAPLPDGRVACLSHVGPIVSLSTRHRADQGTTPWNRIPLPSDVGLFDISPLPDGRLLCSTRRGAELGILDVNSGRVVRLYGSEIGPVHSVSYLGPKKKPPIIASTVSVEEESKHDKAGFLLSQNVFATQQKAADWQRVKAVRIIMGRPFTTRSARHPYDHIGTEGVELGTVPLAADGSFYVRVPADRALAIQAVDAEGRAVVNELSWIYVRPGEHRSCVGCHRRPQDAPQPDVALASRSAPVDLASLVTPHRFRANNAANGGVLNLQFDRFREVASIDLYRQPVLSTDTDATKLPPGRPTAVARLCEILSSGSTAEKVSAARRLAIFRDRAATKVLVAALGDDDRIVRISVATSLAACGDRAAIAPLVTALVDDDSVAAQAAVVALEHLTGHHEQYNACGNRQTQTAGQLRWRAWLDKHNWDEIEGRLIARIDPKRPVESQMAIEALGHVGGKRAKDTLRDYIAKSDPNGSLTGQLAAIRAVGHLRDQRAVPLLAGILQKNIAQTPFKPANSHEFGWSQRPVHLAGAAAEALGRIGTAEAESRLIEAFGRLAPFWYYTFRSGDHEWLKGCHSSIPHYRIAEALDAIGSTKAGPLVGGLLRSVPIDTDRGLLFENAAYETVVARVIHRSGSAKSVVETCLSILGDPDAPAAAQLTAAVKASPPAVSVGILSPESRAAQLLSIVCLHAEHAPRVRAAFARYRQQTPSRQRSWVCFFLARTLGKLGDRDSIGELRAALEQDPTEASFGIADPPAVFLHEAMTPLYRAACADALGRIGRAEAAPTLLKIVGDFDNAMDVRHAAARALGRIADPGSLDQMEQLAHDYPEVATRRALLEACALTGKQRGSK